ncbi:uncharacterized protein LOC119685705 [Teleopsis dalmanni]|uniref:uncharacterized protein LOC119685705 n=1 Tax=Teleopsis dalmanni TaxID=139649 RepID=UPI0018CD715E|nr:uncharacterized protein LOC119685705 [Teleopsis dalmanni]
MSNSKLLIIFIFAIILHESFEKALWSYEYISVNIKKSGTEYIDSDIKVKRISRGRYGLNGFIDIKKDTTDKWIGNISILRSATGNNNYKPTPFEVPTDTVHNIMNGAYKRFFMNSVRNCTTNGVYFKGNFVPPITKRRILLNECNIRTEDWPYLSSGVYKVVVRILGPQYISWDFSFKAVSNIFPS